MLLFLLAAGSLFRSLERIDFQFFALYLNFYMGRKVANTGSPFLGRGGVSAAHLTDSSIDNPITSFTVLRDKLAGAPAENASLFSPEGALSAREYRLTLHF